MNSRKEYWENWASQCLQGKTIASVRYMSDEEMEGMMWRSNPLVIIFTDGSYIYCMADDEGNDGGAIGGTHNGKDILLPTL